jgi:glycine dehydrogenase subunit 1
MSYVLNTPDDEQAMLAAVGLDSLEQLFDVVPEEYRLRRPLALPRALGELELTGHLTALAAKNASCEDRPCFLGAGSYDHFVPAAVDALASRGEFYTAYTPYQAEASQGTLQAVFEYQSLVARLAGLEIANASLYDGGSACAEGVLMALAVTGRGGKVVISGSIHPEYRQILKTTLANLSPELVEVPFGPDGRTDLAALKGAIDEETAAVLIQQPNIFGVLEDLPAIIAEAHGKGVLAIVSADPVSLGLLKRPGDLGADIVVGEGQGLGNHLVYGGPYLGLLACRESYVRKMPGRVVGQTVDHHGKRCWVLTLQTREQHIRREKATSNICTNQGLMALRASIHLALLGPTGLRRVAESSARKAHYAAERLATTPGVELKFAGPFFKEFAIRCPGKDGAVVLAKVDVQGFHGGIALGRWFPELADSILIAVTEKRTKAEIDALAAAYAKALA